VFRRRAERMKAGCPIGQRWPMGCRAKSRGGY
jgi:hypothetical protein